MKQYAKWLTGFMALAMFHALPVSAQEQLDLYDGGDHVIFANQGTATFQAVDAEGNPLDGGTYQIQKGNTGYASWKGNDQTTYSGQYGWRLKENMWLTLYDLPDLVADKGTLRRFTRKTLDGVTDRYTSGGLVIEHEYGTSYTGVYEYIPYEEPVIDLVVPGNTLYFAIDSAWANKKIDGGISLRGDGDIPDFKPASEVSFIQSAGTELSMQVPTGTYTTDGNDANPIVISDTPTEYVKKRVRLPELMPKVFDQNCCSHITMFGVEYTIDPRTDTLNDSVFSKPYDGMYLVFRSGCVVSAALPDADGYVEIYVEKTTREVIVSTNYYTASGSGGGIANGALGIYETMSIPYSVWSLPENAISLTNIDPGTYTLHQKSAPTGRKLAEDITFTIGDPNTTPIFLQMVSDWEDYSISLVQPKHGTVQADAAVHHYQELAEFSAAPEPYYVLDSFIAARGSGEILILEADGCSLLMPAENVAVTAVFRCVNGDCNGDNEIDASDASLALIYAAEDGVGKAPELTAEDFQQMDFNDDGVIDASDASAILSYAAIYGAMGGITQN